ncbi:DUF6893 family small protein [Iamia sp.]|jgi:hypothetical protein
MIRRLLLLGVLAGTAGAAYKMWPDIQRYLKIKQM